MAPSDPDHDQFGEHVLSKRLNGRRASSGHQLQQAWAGSRCRPDPCKLGTSTSLDEAAHWIDERNAISFSTANNKRDFDIPRILSKPAASVRGITHWGHLQ